MKIEITVDDFGLSQEINEATCALCTKGVISKVSILTNTPNIEEGIVELKKSSKFIKYAIHLNLTDGAPLTPPHTVPSLVNNKKKFFGGKHYLIATLLSIGKIRPKEVLIEWEEQIKKALSFDIKIQELNSHGHLHLHPALHYSSIKLAKKYNIPKIRLINTHSTKKGHIYSYLSRSFSKKTLSTADHNIILDDATYTLGIGLEGRLQMKNVLSEIETAPNEKYELITHPGLVGCTYQDSWGWKYNFDYEMLNSQIFHDFHKKNNSQ